MIIVPNMKIEKCKCSDGCVGYDYDPYKEKNIETCKFLGEVDISLNSGRRHPDCPLIFVPEEKESELCKWIVDNLWD